MANKKTSKKPAKRKKITTNKRAVVKKIATKKAAKKKPAPKKKLARKKPASKKRAPKKAASKKAAAKTTAVPRKIIATKPVATKPVATKPAAPQRAPRESRIVDADVPELQSRRTRSAGQSGDLQGLSDTEAADSESVDELLEEGNSFEADVVAGVERAGDDDEEEVHTHEVPEDDVPEEYLDKD
jgi:hypothetical protein